MKLSTTFVLIASAFTGSTAAEIINGNLRASALQKNTEVFADTSIEEDPPADPAVVNLEDCMASCAVLKKPSTKDVRGISEGDVYEGIEECINVCYASDAVVKDRLLNTVPKEKAMECAREASGKYKEVRNKCGSIKSNKSLKCKSCSSDDQGNTDSKCEKELKECEKCEKQIQSAVKSVKKVAKALDECIFNTPSEIEALQKSTDVFVDTSIEEDPAPPVDPVVVLEECMKGCVTDGKPKKKDFADIKEEHVAMGLQACVDACYQYAADNDTTVVNRIRQIIPEANADQCVEDAARKFKEVGKKCGSIKSLKCKSCSSDDQGNTDSKCEKEYDECEKCAKELKNAYKSLNKVGNEFKKCLIPDGAESAIEIA